MNRRTLLLVGALFPGVQACSSTALQKSGSNVRGVGMVVEYRLAPGAAEKQGVHALTDKGHTLFAPARLSERNGGTNHLGGGVVPSWVRVIWREGKDVAMDWKNGGYTGGSVVGDYTVPILELIPREAFSLAESGSKRFVVLRFWLRDDGVDFGWMVRLQDGVPFEVLMKGGDF